MGKENIESNLNGTFKRFRLSETGKGYKVAIFGALKSSAYNEKEVAKSHVSKLRVDMLVLSFWSVREKQPLEIEAGVGEKQGEKMRPLLQTRWKSKQNKFHDPYDET